MLYAVLVVHVLLSIALVISILLHNPQGAGLSSDFTSSLGYGGKTLLERYLDRITIGLGIGLAITTFLLLFLYR